MRDYDKPFFYPHNETVGLIKLIKNNLCILSWVQRLFCLFRFYLLLLMYYSAFYLLFLFLDMFFDGGEGGVAYAMLHFAGVFACGVGIDADARQKSC